MCEDHYFLLITIPTAVTINCMIYYLKLLFTQQMICMLYVVFSCLDYSDEMFIQKSFEERIKDFFVVVYI